MDTFGIPHGMSWPCLENFSTSDPLSQQLSELWAPKRYFSQLQEDSILHQSFFASPAWDCRNMTDGQRHGHCHPHLPTYLELGANNGVSMSNTLFFEQSLGWQGLLIEGVRAHCESLKRDRCRGTAGNVIACGGVCTADHGGQLTFVEMDAVSGAASMGTSQHHLNAWGKGPHAQTVKVPCAPMSAIVARSGLSHRRFSLFSLDVEGGASTACNTPLFPLNSSKRLSHGACSD